MPDPISTILCAIAALAALAFWLRWATAGTSTAKSVVKTLAVGALAVAALSAGALGAALALGLGALGDLALSRSGRRAFLAGLGAFLLGHLVWAGLILSWPGRGAVPPLAAQGLGLAVAGMAAALWRRTGPLRGPVLLYAAVIGGMGLAALTLPVPHPAQGAAALFILSDALLAAGLFLLPRDDPRQRPLALAVWPAYWAAQALFLWAALSNQR